MRGVDFNQTIIKSGLSDSERRLVSARIAENIIPNFDNDAQPVFALNYVPTVSSHPPVETHNALYSEALHRGNGRVSESAIRKREWRGKPLNRAAEKKKRQIRDQRLLASLSPEQREERAAKKREAVYKCRMKKAERRRQALLSDRVVFAQQPATGVSTSPFYMERQMSGLYTLQHHIERLEVHTFTHTYTPIESLPLGEKSSREFYTLQQTPAGRRLVTVTGVPDNRGSPYEVALPAHSFNDSSQNGLAATREDLLLVESRFNPTNESDIQPSASIQHVINPSSSAVQAAICPKRWQ